MINYVEKGDGQHRAIERAGHHLVQRDGVWESDDDAVVQPIMEAYTLAHAQDDMCREVDTYAATLRDTVVIGISPGEMASWPIKRSEAMAYQASGLTSDAPALAVEAVARGVTLTDMAAKVTASAARLSDIEAKIAGTAGKHNDAIRTLTTFADVLAYNWHTGWPL